MKRWEYMSIESNGVDFGDEQIADFNARGTEGWELVSVTHCHYLGGGSTRFLAHLGRDERSYSVAYFKRCTGDYS